MNSKVILFALLGLLANLSACNDNDEPDQHSKSIPLIKTIVTEGNHSDSVFYEYDVTGRVTKESNSPTTYTKFTYSPDKVSWDTYKSNPAYNKSSSISVNSKGLATSRQYGIITYTFKYDSIGYHILTKFDNDTVFYANVVDGNTVMKKDIQPNSYNINTTWEYEFLPNNNTIGYENMGMAWWGKQDKNLSSKETQVLKMGSIVQETIIEYTYEYDSQNRVTKRTTIRNANLYLTETYTYY